ncbi:hypothetical protein C0J52_24783 [Blattella germanica]|nr:hypothetical protein C0J52_24783 [Blattella germanica]
MENHLKVVAENDRQLVTEENSKNREVENRIEINVKVEYEPNFELEDVGIKQESNSSLPVIKSEFEVR